MFKNELFWIDFSAQVLQLIQPVLILLLIFAYWYVQQVLQISLIVWLPANDYGNLVIYV